MSEHPSAIRAEDLELPEPDPFQQIQNAAFQAYDRDLTRRMAEDLAPGRVYEGVDGSVWIVQADRGPGVELSEMSGWRMWP